jgi:addiction module RelE/StbE family toxin
MEWMQKPPGGGSGIRGGPSGVRTRVFAVKVEFAGRRECHIEPDWLLVYRLEPGVVIFERTGTHSDLFG